MGLLLAIVAVKAVCAVGALIVKAADKAEMYERIVNPETPEDDAARDRIARSILLRDLKDIPQGLRNANQYLNETMTREEAKAAFLKF